MEKKKHTHTQLPPLLQAATSQLPQKPTETLLEPTQNRSNPTQNCTTHPSTPPLEPPINPQQNNNNNNNNPPQEGDLDRMVRSAVW